MNSLHTPHYTQEISKIDLSENPHYIQKENDFLGWCQKRISIFLETHDIPDEFTQQFLLQISDKIKKSISPITIGYGSQVIEKYKVDFFLDSSFENEICNRATYCIWRKNMKKYIQTPASITPRVIKVLAYNKVEVIGNLSVENFLSGFHLFPTQAQESLFQEKATLEKHSQRVNQAQDYLQNMDFNSFSEEKIKQDGWFTGFYESVDFPDIEQKSTIPDIEYEKFVAERKNKEPQPIFATEKPKDKPTIEIEKTTKLSVAALFFAGALVAGSYYNLQSIDDKKLQENIPEATKFNEKGFRKAFYDILSQQMSEGIKWEEIQHNVAEVLGKISASYGIKPSDYNYVLTKTAEKVDLELMQKGKVVYFFRYDIPNNFSMYIESVDSHTYAEKFKQYILEKTNEYRNKNSSENFRNSLAGFLSEEVNIFLQNNLDERKHLNLEVSVLSKNDSIEIVLTFKNQDNIIIQETRFIIPF